MKKNHFHHAIILSLTISSTSFIQASQKRTVQFDFSNLEEQLGGISKNTTQNILTGIVEGIAGTTNDASFSNAIGNFFKNFFRQGSGELADAIKDKEFQNNIKETTSASSKLIGDTTKDILRQTSGELVDAITDKEFQGNIKKTTSAIGNTTKEIIQQINNELSDEELRKEMKAASAEATKTMGIATEEFANGLNKYVLPQIDRMSGNAISSVFNFKNAFRFGAPLAVGIALPLVGLYGSRVFWNVLEKKLLTPKPQILLPCSKYGRWDRISRWRSGYESPTMLFDQQVKDRLIEIEEKTKNIRDHIRKGKKTTYDNLLLYGKPGTGKTLFAQILADKTNMDFLPVTAASLLQSGVEGIKYFDELLIMANKSKYGVIIFVDEADALFVNRDTLSPESDHYKVLNHILALTGTGSNKFMLVAATNHAYVMDQAMGRRFQDRILMPLPDTVTRQKLLVLYSEQLLFNIKENNKEFVETAKKLLTPTMINNIVDQTNSLSHAEIKDMVVAMHKKACATKTGMITIVHIQSAVQEAIEKKQALEEDKKLLEQKINKN